ncbi:hypothetical protein [Nitratireductor sp. ZSWI3]|uniref:hypothetical protein n=1 Tax=Nitratireductor sp. ZSWI3 TaxID=2966359 RepID=UPI00214F7778|nr:hypothetical protein [Nitratireductor sp. ZSWI3]MCR4265727.1 hypothetical protein [Nitratireductor sp. ZSWI3]
MSEAGQNRLSASNVRSLADAVREMKNAAADRADVVIDMREASRARLELLAQELEPIFAEVPKDDPAFDLAISSGEQPRLWIDAVAHVVMARDHRTFRFVRDTRLGRVVLAESADMKPVADQVTRYIAERMVERQRAVEGEVETLPRRPAEESVPAELPRRGGWRAFLSGALFVLLGGLVGAAAVMFVLSDRFPELTEFLSRF